MKCATTFAALAFLTASLAHADESVEPALEPSSEVAPQAELAEEPSQESAPKSINEPAQAPSQAQKPAQPAPNALETSDQMTRPYTPMGPHRLYLGLDFFRLHARLNVARQQHVRGKSSCTIPDMTMKFDAPFIALALGYEFLKPDALYAGFDFLYGWGADSASQKIKYFSTFCAKKEKGQNTVAERCELDNNMALSHTEGRFGYSFGKAGSFLISPFGGLGFYSWHQIYNHCYSLKRQWIYAAAGALSTYTVASRLDLGLSAKAMHDLYTHWRSSLTKGKKSPYRASAWGYEAAAPITFRFDQAGVWAAKVEPYFTMLDAKADMYIYGGRLLLDCRF